LRSPSLDPRPGTKSRPEGRVSTDGYRRGPQTRTIGEVGKVLWAKSTVGQAETVIQPKWGGWRARDTSHFEIRWKWSAVSGGVRRGSAPRIVSRSEGGEQPN